MLNQYVLAMKVQIQSLLIKSMHETTKFAETTIEVITKVLLAKNDA